MSIILRTDYSQIEKRLTGQLPPPILMGTEGTSVTGRLPRESVLYFGVVSQPQISRKVELAIMSVVLGRNPQFSLARERFNLMYGSGTKDPFERFARHPASDLRAAIAKILH